MNTLFVAYNLCNNRVVMTALSVLTDTNSDFTLDSGWRAVLSVVNGCPISVAAISIASVSQLALLHKNWDSHPCNQSITGVCNPQPTGQIWTAWSCMLHQPFKAWSWYVGLSRGSTGPQGPILSHGAQSQEAGVVQGWYRVPGPRIVLRPHPGREGWYRALGPDPGMGAGKRQYTPNLACKPAPYHSFGLQD